MEQAMREEFEAWHHAEFGYVIAVEDDPEQDGQCAKRWKAWQASRAALRVELPDKAEFVEYYEDLEGGTFNWQRYMVAIQEALQQAGIEVK
ncbi:hypothetical protein N0687_04890 [Pseudomonas aeruginosa]|nr:hypothetical protein [Pseudomonas aeruginosa]MCT0870733.1 hypothetical protein [Pseudomonas aeruginosa]MCT0901165.1 hypothetical protein [Pseudomonas aeruginosa]MCT0925655.1 hypothetical protein [Pseudomonas aeruginosa]